MLGFPAVLSEIKNRVLAVLPGGTKRAAEQAKRFMQERPRRGESLDGPMPFYAPGSRKRGRVTLTETGDMLADLEVQPDRSNGAFVRFRTKAQEMKARWQHFGTVNMDPHTFVGLTQSEADIISADFGREVISVVKPDRRTRLRLYLFR